VAALHGQAADRVEVVSSVRADSGTAGAGPSLAKGGVCYGRRQKAEGRGQKIRRAGKVTVGLNGAYLSKRHSTLTPGLATGPGCPRVSDPGECPFSAGGCPIVGLKALPVPIAHPREL